MKKVIYLIILISLINIKNPIVYAEDIQTNNTETVEKENQEELTNPKTGNIWVYVIFGIMFFSCAALISSDYFELQQRKE